MNIHEKIGEGSYGSVFKVEKRNKVYAMKKLNIENLQNYEKKCIISELKILSGHESKYLIKYYFSEIVGKHLCIYTEFIDGGDLSSKIKKHSAAGTSFSPSELQRYFGQLCIALKYLHSNNIIHRDIKPSNILVRNDNIKLIDFGISKICDKYLKYTKTFVGTPYYISPEQFRNVNYNYKVDIWSLGCLMYELHEHTVPFKGSDIVQLRNCVLSKSPYYKKTSRFFKPLITKCLCKSPYGRPEITWLLKQCENTEMDKKLPKIQIQNVIVKYKHFDWRKFIESLPKRNESPAEQLENDYQQLVNLPKLHLIKMIHDLRKEIDSFKHR
jgi:serine/threonine protein kinase